MKRANFIMLFTLLVSIIFIQTGCKKNSDPPAPVPAGPLGVTVNGSALVFTNVTSSVQQYSVAQYTYNYVRIIGAVGTKGDYFVINIYNSDINSNTPVDISKIYSFDIGYLNGGTYINASSDLTASGATGTITLTKNDLVNKRLEGSFTGVMVDGKGGKIPVTGGSFAVNY